MCKVFVPKMFQFLTQHSFSDFYIKCCQKYFIYSAIFFSYQYQKINVNGIIVKLFTKYLRFKRAQVQLIILQMPLLNKLNIILTYNN